MTKTRDLWADLVSRLRDLRLLGEMQSILTWDQQTHMPAGAAEARGAQLGWLMERAHERLNDPALGDLLGELRSREGDLVERQRAGLRNVERTWRREVRVPAELVARLGQLQGQGFAAWMQARQTGDFAVFAPVLTEIVGAVRDRALAQDADADPYATMVDEFDPGLRPAELDGLFERLESGLSELLDAIRGADPMPKLQGLWPREAQLALASRITEELGYSSARGRMDESEHPFTATLGPDDVRITTRVDDDDLLMVLGATIHEAGHALYEQGIPTGSRDDGVSEAASMGLHESQSRFWENRIGGSHAFCQWLQGPLHDTLGASAPDADVLYRASNRVEAGPVRVTADEVTYNLHITIRYQLERQLISGALAIDDLPAAWNDAYASKLGVKVENDLEGVLQDVHWSSCAFGYFPSYTLGNLYAASFARTLEVDLPDLEERVAVGNFRPIVAWLRDRIHRHGHVLEAPDLVRRVTGSRDGVSDLLDHLWARHGALHGVSR